MNSIHDIPLVPWLRCRDDAIRSRAKSQKIRGLLAADHVREKLSHSVSLPHNNWYFVSAKAVIETHATLHGAYDNNAKMLSMELSRLGSRYLLPYFDPLSPYTVTERDINYNNIFIRPCPVRPRHGFVDSRRVRNWRDMVKIAQETLDADPDGELLLTKFISADASAVLTPSTFSYGGGNDGATSGKSVTIYGPSPALGMIAHINELASIDHGDVPYVELVYDRRDYGPKLVQVRGGPEQSGSVDFIPRETVVKEVLTATEDMDLLVWEKVIAEAKAGTVVHAPDMSLASHFCVHAVIHDVPVLTSKVPVVGETLVKIDAPKWSAKDYRRLASAIRKADIYVNARNAKDGIARVAVAALHCAGAPSDLTEAQARFLALGAVATAKYIAAAIIGEARHASSVSRDYSPEKRSKRAVKACSERCERGAERNSFYSSSFDASIPALAHCLFALVPVFRDRQWDSSYGGNKWAAINAGARRLLNALATFETKPCKGNWIAVIEAWNQAITREHNGKAPALSKWGVDKGYMTNAAKWPVSCLVGFPTVLLDYLTGRREIELHIRELVGPAPKYYRRDKSVEHKRTALIRRHRNIDGRLGILVEHRRTRSKITWVSMVDLEGDLLAKLSGISAKVECDIFQIDGVRYLMAKVCATLKAADAEVIPQAVRTLYKVLDVPVPELIEEVYNYRPDTLKVEGFGNITLDVTEVLKNIGEC